MKKTTIETENRHLPVTYFRTTTFFSGLEYSELSHGPKKPINNLNCSNKQFQSRKNTVFIHSLLYYCERKYFLSLRFWNIDILKIALLCIFYIIVVFKFQMKKKITSDFIILFLVYCLNSIYIFFFPQNSLRWWRPNSMAGLVCEWRGNSDVICIFVYRRPWIFALKPNTWLFYFIFFQCCIFV